MTFNTKIWEGLPSQDTPLDADGLNDLEARIEAAFADLGGTRDGEPVNSLIIPEAGTQANAIVVEAPDEDWGYPNAGYGVGQAFLLVKEDDGVTAWDERVLARIDGRGGAGLAGGLHMATGLRARPEDEASLTYSIHIDPTLDSIGLIIEAADGGVADLLQLYNNTDTLVGKFTSTGLLDIENGIDVSIIGTGTIARFRDDGTVRATIENDGSMVIAATNASGQVAIGPNFGVPTIGLGTVADCFIHRGGTGSLWLNPTTEVKIVDAYVEYDELTADPSAPPADGGRLYLRDNGSGKTQLCIKFNTGAVQVLATQP